MSEHPLTPQNLAVIICGTNANQIADAMKPYGTDAATVAVTSVQTVAEAKAARIALPSNTPWCILSHADEFVIDVLRDYFGAARTLADCLNMTPNDYAIHPSRLT